MIENIVCTLLPFLLEGVEGGIEPLIKLSKKMGLKGAQFLEGVTFSREGEDCCFLTNNKLKSEIFSDTESL